MSKSDLTPEEKETIQKSKDPSVIMSADGTTRTTEEATIYVCDLDMFVQFHLVKEPPAVLSLGTLCEKTVTRMNIIQVSHHISSRMVENRL